MTTNEEWTKNSTNVIKKKTFRIWGNYRHKDKHKLRKSAGEMWLQVASNLFLKKKKKEKENSDHINIFTPTKFTFFVYTSMRPLASPSREYSTARWPSAFSMVGSAPWRN